MKHDGNVFNQLKFYIAFNTFFLRSASIFSINVTRIFYFESISFTGLFRNPAFSTIFTIFIFFAFLFLLNFFLIISQIIPTFLIYILKNVNSLHQSKNSKAYYIVHQSMVVCNDSYMEHVLMYKASIKGIWIFYFIICRLLYALKLA